MEANRSANRFLRKENKMSSEVIFQRLALLAEFSRRAKLGRTAIMKLMFFLQERMGVPLNYQFSLYSYGPFDSDVLADISTAERLNVLRSSVEYYPSGTGYLYEPGPEAQSVNQYCGSAEGARVRDGGAGAGGSTSHPVLAQIVPARFCNLSCGYCNEYDKVSRAGAARRDVRRIDHLGRLGTAMIGISGGEPLTHPQLDDIIRRMRKTGAIAGMITNGYLLNVERIERLNRAGLDHMQISIDNVEPDEVSKKSLKVLDKKLQMLAEYAEFHVNINSVVGGGFKDPNDALVIGRRALELGFESTIGIIHDGDGQLKPLKPDEARVYFEMTTGRRPTTRSSTSFRRRLPRGAERLAVPGGVAVPVYLRGRAGALLLAAARVSGGSDCGVYDGGCEAGVFDGEELRAELHDWVRAPDQPYRPLAGAADADGFAGEAGKAGLMTQEVNQDSCSDKKNPGAGASHKNHAPPLQKGRWDEGDIACSFTRDKIDFTGSFLRDNNNRRRDRRGPGILSGDHHIRNWRVGAHGKITSFSTFPSASVIEIRLSDCEFGTSDFKYR
jgi:hypothetical protein